MAMATALPLLSRRRVIRTRSVFGDVAVQMGDEERAAVERDGADAPGGAFAEIDIGAGADRCFRQHGAAGGDVLERHARRTGNVGRRRAGDTG